MQVKQNKRSGDRILDSSIGSILGFAVPLFLSNIFQQLYNVVDSFIVGNYLGKNELAAVGTCGNVMFLGVGIFTGIATGSGVVIGNYYGAGDRRRLKESIHTAIAVALLGGILLSIVGVLASRTVLIWMNVPGEVLPDAVKYLRIYFAALVFPVIYNMGTGILTAEGDSRHPLQYLMITSVLNILLDLVFICGFSMGIEGAAYATALSQAASTGMVMIRLCRQKEGLGVSLKQIRLYGSVLGRIVKIGLPTGIQTGVIAFSNIIVQSYINRFGVDAISGCSIFIKIDGFLLQPIVTFGLVAMTMTSQNIGLGRLETIWQGVRKTLFISLFYIIVASLCLELFAESLIGIFNQDPDVIAAGCRMLRILTPGYWMLAVTHVFVGMFRGSGRSLLAMLIMLMNLVVFRIVFLAVLMPVFPRLDTVLWSYTVSWVTAIVTALFFRFRINWPAVWEEQSCGLKDRGDIEERMDKNG